MGGGLWNFRNTFQERERGSKVFVLDVWQGRLEISRSSFS